MYATLEEIREYLSVDEHTDDPMLTTMIERASATIDTYAGRKE